MSEDFLALSFDCPISPGVEIVRDINSAPQVSSWGFVWYPTNSNVVSSFKGGNETPWELIAHTFSDWKRLLSTTFLCHFSNSTCGTDKNNVQPFSKVMAGKDWTWLATGIIEKTGHEFASTFNEAVGSTGSEESFCILLDFLNNSSCRDLTSIDPTILYRYFNDKDRYLNSNVILSDGQNILVFRGCESVNEIYVSRMIPPHANNIIANKYITVDIEGVHDSNKTVAVISSTQLIKDNQRVVEPGGMVIISRGNITWESMVKNCDVLTEQTPRLDDSSAVLVPKVVKPNTPITTNIKSIVASDDGIPLGFRMLNVLHKTVYKYSKPVRRSTHLFRLSPVEDEIQAVEEASIEFSIPSSPIFFEDAFGNRVVHITIEEPYKELSVISRAKIKIYAAPPDNFSSPLRRVEIPLLWMPWQRQMMLPYLLPPELPESQLSELSEYAMSFVERNNYLLLETLADINNSIYRDFKYASNSTNNSTSVFDVYVNRAGVCQDFANLFICLARILSVPSRYRMGYIYTGGEYENKVQSDASHAWIEVYLPYLGWRGYDPTNGCLIQQDHIRVACGRNYIDATPTSGTIYKGGDKEELSIEVKIEE